MSQISNGSRLHFIGPFRAKLISAHHTADLPVPERLRASLLTNRADPLGRGHTECARAAAARCPVRLERVDRLTLVIPHEFGFHLPGSGLIQQLGLFDDEARLRFFGPISSSKQRFERPEEFRFMPSAVEILHSQSAYASELVT